MSGGHDKASGKAIGQSRRFGSGMVDVSAVDMSRLYGVGSVGGIMYLSWVGSSTTNSPGTTL